MKRVLHGEDGSGKGLAAQRFLQYASPMNVTGLFIGLALSLLLRLSGFPDDQISSLAQVANHVVQLIVCHVLGDAHGVVDVYFKLLQTSWMRRGRRSLGAGDLPRLSA